MQHAAILFSPTHGALTSRRDSGPGFLFRIKFPSGPFEPGRFRLLRLFCLSFRCTPALHVASTTSLRLRRRFACLDAFFSSLRVCAGFSTTTTTSSLLSSPRVCAGFYHHHHPSPQQLFSSAAPRRSNFLVAQHPVAAAYFSSSAAYSSLAF